MTRCPNCGLPLSPTNPPANCPRCYTAIATSGNARSANPPMPSQQNFEQSWGRGVQAPAYPQPQTNAWGTATPQQQWETPSFTPSPQTPQQVWQPTPQPSPIQAPTYASYNQVSNGRPPLKRPASSNNLGFIVAGLCVFTGALLLIFVYFMAAGLPGVSTANNTTNTPVSTSQIVPTQASTPTVNPSPTPTPFPGQQYIDNAQMASAVDTTTAKAQQLTTTFKVGQKMYVTFDLHPNGTSGAVCLNWFLNGTYITDYSFAVNPNNTVAYSYAIYGNAGDGSVEISWASSKACTDKTLAQKVAFTVTSA